MWDDHTLKEYKAKSKELGKPLKPILLRKSELEARPEAVKYAREQIASIRAYIANETACVYR